MRIAIVDDSRLARLELKTQIDALPDEFDIVGEADSVASAVDLINRVDIDVVLLDIDLPDGNGFDVLEKASKVPQVIFVTAFNEYAIKSFEVNALDYLLKPTRAERLQQALAKVDDAVEERRLEPEKRIFIKDRDKCFFVSVGEVQAFEAMGNYTRVHLDKDKPSVYRPISSIESRVDPEVFFKASRSWLVNTNFIANIEPAISGGFDLELTNGSKLAISKRQAAEFKKKWSL
ncbi:MULTISPECIES: LytTR family DNA-binding domain-containing protein [Gammaproteobacteria]|uniref:LytR/AlgR family response regulator transcription factor n=1 Tax=Gammaproteobacteria TaxID=1236 RepID=UPI000DCFF517|nr:MULTISPECIES: LytTR family DNA-binding domain-containing protein [Gammaproteobacteria]RTE85733.1 response regulator transcription factor [Aliidiomarina sp. B3213]TCZ90265.1 response regulator transcription factor [Lysobacter sp. N42]